MSQGFFLSLYILKGRKDTMTKIRTRFAPSPTGRMHVGNLRTALYAYLIAKHEGGDFILRIEDTDQERYVEGAVDIIYRTMAGTGLIHDEGPDKDKGYGPYVQSERQASGLYLKYAQQLIEQGAVVMGPQPSRSPSLQNQPEADEQVRQMAAEIWGDVDGVNVKSRKVGKGMILNGMTMEEAFALID